jgi:transcriptional regulator with XRE-family HTH domain
MKNHNIYDHLDYKSLLREELELRKSALGNRVTFERMAKACGVQKTYFSRVLNTDAAHLSQDQLYQACLYLGLTKDERRFVSLLLEHERATVSRRKEDLAAEIDAIRKRRSRSESYLRETPTASLPSAAAAYFLDPEAILVHVFMTTETFAGNVREIQRRLHLSDHRLSEILAQLQQHGLIGLDDAGGYRVLVDRLHLPADAEIYPAYRVMQRLKTVERLRQLDGDHAYSFSAVFTADEATRHLVKGKLLKLLGEIEPAASSAPAQEVFQLNLDLFDWSSG